MGVNIKGGMYCPSCGKSVVAVKPTHKFRNTIATASAPLGGLGVLLGKHEKWLCPDCGGKAVSATPSRVERAATRRNPIDRRLAEKRATTKRPEWRCEKNGHLLDPKRDTCPVDGSSCGWTTPS